MAFLASAGTESLSLVFEQGNVRVLHTFCFTLPLLWLVQSTNTSEPLWLLAVVAGFGAWLGNMVSIAEKRSKVIEILHGELAKANPTF